MSIIEAVALVATAVGSLGWIVAFFRFSSENRRDQAAAAKSLQEVNDLLLSEYAALVTIKNNEIDLLHKRNDRWRHDYESLTTEHQSVIVQRDEAIQELAEAYALIAELEQK